ncbi:MAG TPA: hypothetical protein VNU45_17920 [Rummeliibacillus sp.]|nr:hypothetical protein [Rummeliibacillus sp.]
MTKNRSECVDTARKALNHFTGEELESFIKQVNTRTMELKAQGIPFARDAALGEINNLHLEMLLDDSARAARNIGKWDTNSAKMDTIKNIKPRAFLEKTAVNTDYNVETAGNAAKQRLNTQAFGNMTKEHLDALEEKTFDDAIFAVADGGTHENPMIVQIGKSLREYIDPRNAMLIKSDAMQPSAMNEDRFFKNMYDQSKLLKIGRESWIELHKSRIDVDATFRNTKAMDVDGKIDDQIVNEMIGNTFDNIIQGNGPLFTRASVSRDRQAIERTRHMFYKYKDWKSWGMSNKEYGQGSLIESWMGDIRTSGQQVGLAEIMGSAPQSMWLEMRHKQVKMQGDEANSFKNGAEHQLSDAIFNNILGATSGVMNPKIANISASIRSITSVARLGKIALLSLSDTANIAGFAQRAGAGYWSPYINAIVNMFDKIPSSESRIALARIMSSSIQVHSGTVSRFSDLSGLGDTVNKLSNKFFHRVGLHALDRGNKLSAMEPIMKVYGKQSNKSFKALDVQQQAYLKRFNISEAEWDALRSKTENKMFSTDNVTKMSDDEIRELWNDTDKIVPLSEYGSTLYRKAYAMFDTAQEFSVLNPTAYTNTITTGNFRPGHIGGEAWRMFAQFKAYPAQYFRRVWIGGMQDFDSYQGKMMFALNQCLGTIMLASLSEALIAVSQNLTPPNPANMSRGEQVKYFAKILGGGLGVFGSLLGDKTTSKSAIGALFGTPTWKFLYDPAYTAFALATGDLKGAKNAAREFANVANPISTVPGISPFVDSFLGNKPYVEPGQHSIF